jgi:hypothetical protein
MPFALYEMKVLLATVLSQVRPSRPAGVCSTARRYGIVLGPDDGGTIVVRSLERLVLRHQAWIYNIAVRMVFQPQDAEEVTGWESPPSGCFPKGELSQTTGTSGDISARAFHGFWAMPG